MRRCLLAALVFAGALSSGSDAAAQTRQQFDIWAGLFVNGQFKSDAPSGTTWFDLQGRRSPGSTTLIVRPGLGYVIRPWVTVWLGYAWIPEFIDETGERIDVDVGVGSNLACQHDQVVFQQRFASDPRVDVLLEHGVEDGIRDLIGHLVGVALGDGLRGEGPRTHGCAPRATALDRRLRWCCLMPRVEQIRA